jgi:transposase
MASSMLDAMNEARNEGGTYRRVEVITGRQRRRRWTVEEKARIVAESLEPDANISDVARRHGVARGLLTVWRRQLSGNGRDQRPEQSFAVVKVASEAPGPEVVTATLPAVRGRGRIEIDVAGARVRVESGVDQATLAVVLAVVRGDK